MYYVNEQQIEKRLQFIPRIVSACEQLRQDWVSGNETLYFAQERAIHLAIETVTDIGSLMIDGFLMRDASSYEDIIEILRGEDVFPGALAEPLVELVKLRKPLVQDYTDFEREGLHPMIVQLPALLRDFAEAVRAYLRKELG